MQVRQLEYFLAVVDHGGVNRAAEALHVAQPSLSQAIRALERQIGAELFHRAGRRLVLSQAGEAIVDPARRVVRDLRMVRAAADAVRGLTGGHLEIATLATLAVDPVAELVGAFRARYPAISFGLAEPGNAEAVGHLVRIGDCELGFAHLPLRADGLRTVPLGQQELVVVLPPGTQIDDAPLGYEQLAELPWVVSPVGTSTRTLLHQCLADLHGPPHIAVETAHREAILPLVVNGAGATLLPRRIAERADTLGVVVRRTEPAITRAIGVVHRPEPLSPAAAVFLALARDRIGADKPAGRAGPTSSSSSAH